MTESDPNPDDLSLNHPRGIADQPPPVPNDQPSIQALVRLDLEAREHLGITRYGTPLQPHNGRDALVDAYQEAMDLAIYLRQVIAEIDIPAPGLELPHVGRMRSAADGAAAALDVHRAGAMGGAGLSSPAVHGGEQLVDLPGPSNAHQGTEPMKQGHDGVNVAVLPGPRCLAVLAPRFAAVNVAGAHEVVNAVHDVLVGHGDQDADEGAGSAVLVVTGGQVEAPLAFQQAGQPSNLAIVHGAQCSKDASCAALDLACYLRQAIAERHRRPVAASQPSAMLRAGALAAGRDLDDAARPELDDMARRAVADPGAFKRYLDEVEEAQQ